MRPDPALPDAGAPPVQAAGACAHCGAALESALERFCCTGCETAEAIIRGAGLARYYREREACAPRPEPPTGGWSAVPVADGPAGAHEVRLQVDGLRCASCVWLLEHVLERTPGVQQAMVSYATGRAAVRWDPQRTDLAGIAHRIAALGYRPRPLGQQAAPDRDLLVRLGVAAFLALGLMFVSEVLYAGWWTAVDAPVAALLRLVALALATPLTFWCALPFFEGAWAGLRRGVLHMDLPIALGVAVLYAHGAWAALAGVDSYLDSLGMLVALLLVGRMLEGRSRRRAVEAAMALAATAPRTARRQRGDRLETVPADQLRPGDLLDVGAGEELAADGVVREGAGQVRLALITGEAAPVAVGPGERVVAGTVLVDGALTVQVEAVGAGTMLSRMAEALAAAAERGMRPSSADRLAPWFTAGTLVVALATFAGWWLGRDLTVAVARTVAVLVVACPCTLALAQPLAGAAGLGAAARRGLLFRDAASLLAFGDADLLALDKTGTVTAGALTVTEADDATLRLAAGLERYSAHPIARAIVAAASARGLALPRGVDVREEPGSGMHGWVDGREWRLVAGGPGTVLLVDDAGSARRIALGDVIRPDAASTIAALRDLGLTPVLLTGDHPDVAARLARLAGIGEVHARQRPEAKAAWVEARRQEGRRVAFAGDGLNDGPALAAADVGLAMGTGAASSVLVADGVVAHAALAPLLAARRAARAAARAIRVNERLSIAYNVLAVVAAAAGLVNPLVAALLMPLSSALVVWVATRVERVVAREAP